MITIFLAWTILALLIADKERFCIWFNDPFCGNNSFRYTGAWSYYGAVKSIVLLYLFTLKTIIRWILWM